MEKTFEENAKTMMDKIVRHPPRPGLIGLFEVVAGYVENPEDPSRPKLQEMEPTLYWMSSAGMGSVAFSPLGPTQTEIAQELLAKGIIVRDTETHLHEYMFARAIRSAGDLKFTQ